MTAVALQLGDRKKQQSCSTIESHQDSANHPSSSMDCDVATASDEDQYSPEKASANPSVFTMRDLQDHLYTLVTNDPLGIKRSPGTYYKSRDRGCSTKNPHLEEWKDLVPRASEGEPWENEAQEIPWPDIQDDFNSFTPFPRLPKELRLQIWKLALPDPRLVLMISDNLPNLKYSPKLEGHEPVSHTFHELICQESWAVLSENYSRLEFEESVKGIPDLARLSLVRGIPDRIAYIRSGNGVQAYLDCSRDTLLVSPVGLRNVESMIDTGILLGFGSVRHLAICPEYTPSGMPFLRNGRWPWDMSSALCSSLDKFTVILGVIRPRKYVQRWTRYRPSLTEIGAGTQNPTSHGRDLNRRFVSFATHLQQQYRTQQISAAGEVKPMELNVSVVTWEHLYSSQYSYYERISLSTVALELSNRSCSFFIERPIEPLRERFHYCVVRAWDDWSVFWKHTGVVGGSGTKFRDYCYSDAFNFDKYLKQVNEREGLTRYGGELILKPRGKRSSWKLRKTEEEITNRMRYPYLNQWA